MSELSEMSVRIKTGSDFWMYSVHFLCGSALELEASVSKKDKNLTDLLRTTAC